MSAAIHLSLLVAAAGLSRRDVPAESTGRRDRPAENTRRIDMIYMPPPDPSPPSPPVRPQPATPPPTVRQTAPEPEPNAPPEATRSSGDESVTENAEPEEGEPSTQPAPAPVTPAEERPAVTMESEARRIFGRPRLATPAGAGPQAVRPMEAWLPDRSERCIPRPSLPRDSAGPIQLAMVAGRIFRQDNGRPLAGAHLQMVGTPHVAFTDGNGEYRFRFDLALVDNCRTQYVKVTAAGYESRLLVLVVGPQIRSEDVHLRRR